MVTLDLPLLERWLTGWSLARGLPLPRACGGGLVVEVGWPTQVRRHVFVDAGPALQACAAGIHAPFVFLKATVAPPQLRRALPAQWQLEAPRYLMVGPAAHTLAVPLPAGYALQACPKHGASVLCLFDAMGQTAARGRVLLHRGTAIFDRIETEPAHRRRGLATHLMGALEAVAAQAGVSDRLLVATEAGRALYLRLGWQEVAPYATAVLPVP